MNPAWTHPRFDRLRGRMVGILFTGLASAGVFAQTKVETWMTTEDLRCRLSAQNPAPVPAAAEPARRSLVEVDSRTSYQTILGLGSSLEPATCWNLALMTPRDRETWIARLVDPSVGIGMNLMRVCMGTPDFTGDPWYSYDDLPAGQTDPELKHFSIEKDRAYILPALKLARKMNSNLLFFASPWSPPGWMKTTGHMTGGRLRPEFYPSYAEYFVRFIHAYEAEGIPVHAVTVQNEPGVDRSLNKDPKWHYPSCRWTAEQERDFIRDHLGPAIRQAGLTTEIWCYDHNYNVKASGDDPGLSYPRTILTDHQAAQLVSGVAFHGYEGKPEAMTQFHNQFPSMPIYFTEGSVFGIDGSAQLVERLRNWARSYAAWVTVLDDCGKPNNGPFPATHAMIKLDSKTKMAEALFEYYAYGQFMKFIQRGARRISSSSTERDLAHVGFQNPDESVVLVVVNPDRAPCSIQARWNSAGTTVNLPSRSVVTFKWTPDSAMAPPQRHN